VVIPVVIGLLLIPVGLPDASPHKLDNFYKATSMDKSVRKPYYPF